MAAALFDINFLLALAWPHHQFHAVASTWFARHKGKGWATCAVTQLGFVRLSSNRNYLGGEVKTPAEACQILTELIRHPRHQFLPDLEAPIHFREFSRIMDHRDVTDAYLVGVARVAAARLVTFDRGIASLAGPEAVEILRPH
jgi:toxin-antitoxin system PIN domain toxin